MFSFFNLKAVTIFLVSVLSIKSNPITFEDCFNTQESVQIICGDLHDILYEVDCFNLSDCGTFRFKILPQNFDQSNLERVNYFLSNQILISKLEPKEIFRNSFLIPIALKNLEDNINNQTEESTLDSNFKSYEYVLFEHMTLAILFIGKLMANIENIKAQSNDQLRAREIELAKEICSKLFDTLHLVRYASFLDCAFSKEEDEKYDFRIKFEFASNIYSMAILALEKLKNHLNN